MNHYLSLFCVTNEYGINQYFMGILVESKILLMIQRIKWFSACTIIIAMIFHVMGWTPWNSLLQMLGAAGWVYWGIKSGEKAIILNFLPQFFIIIPGLIILYFTK